MSTGWTKEMVEAHNRKLAGVPDAPPAPPDAAKLEIEEIHEPFMKWLNERQIPYIRARSDMASTIGEGVQDFTVFYQGRVICIECKSKTGKVTPQQLGWKLLMERQTFPVHVARSLRECIELVTNPQPKQEQPTT